MNDSKKLYDSLKDQGYSDLGEFSDFENKLKDSGKREILYNALQRDGFSDIGSLDEFNTRLGYPLHSESETPNNTAKRGGFLDTYLGDVLEKVNAGAADMFAGGFGVLDKGAKGLESITGGLLKSGGAFKQISDYFRKDAEISRANSNRYNRKSYSDLWNEGDYSGAIGDIVLQGAESLPMSIAAIASGPATGLVGIGAITANDKYDQLDVENPHMKELPKIINSLLTGTAEALSEKLGAGATKLWMKSLYKALGKEAAEKAVRTGVIGMVKENFKKYGILYEPLAEGLEEVSSQLAENITDKITGADSQKNLSDGLFDSFVYGTGGGAYFSAAGIPGLAKRQYDKIKTRKDYNNAKDAFYTEFEGDDKMLGIGSELESATPEEKVAFLEALESDTKFTEKQKDALFNLVQSNIAYKSLRAPQAIEEEKSERRELLIQTEMMNYDNAISPITAENGMIQQVYINGDKKSPVYIIKGNVSANQNENGELLFDPDKSDKSLYYMDADGNTQVISPSQVTGIGSLSSIEDSRAQYEAGLRYQLDMQEQISKQQQEQEIENGDDIIYLDNKGERTTGRVVDGFSNPEYVFLEDGASVPRELISKAPTQTEQVMKDNSDIKDDNTLQDERKNKEGVVEGRSGTAEELLNKTLNQIRESLPKKKNGDIDYKAMTPMQQYEYTSIVESPDIALSDLKSDIELKEGEISKLNDRVNKTSGGERAAIRDEIRQRNAELKELQLFYSSVNSYPEQIQPIPQADNSTETILQETDMQPTGEIKGRQIQSSASDIPLNEDGNPIYHKASIEDTISDLARDFDNEEIDEFIKLNRNEVQKQLNRLKSKKPKVGTNKSQYLANKKIWQEQVDDLQVQIKYWGDVENAVKESRELPGDKAAEEIKFTGGPLSGEELAAMMLANGSLRLTQDSYEKETGAGKEESKKMFGLFASPANGGVNIERAGELLMLADMENRTNFFDQNDPNAGRNAIIDVLSSARTRGDLINYIKTNREAMAERERQAEYNEYAAWCEENYHLPPEDYEAYEQDVRKQAESVTDEAIEYINGEIADEIQSIKEERRERDAILAQNKESNEKVERNDEGGTVGLPEGGDQLLQDEQFVQTGRTGKPKTEYTGANNSISIPDGTAQESTSGKIKPTEKIDNTKASFEIMRDVASEQKTKREISDAEQEVNINPTEAQKEAGNYKKGHVKIDGFDITIEQPAGSVRSGKDAGGKEWSVIMRNTYGYIRGTEGVDGDHIDIFLSDNPSSGNVFVVDQVNPDGSFDEHKVMYGFASKEEAKAAYLANYSPGWNGLSNITEVSKEEFKKWVDSSKRKTKPFAEYKIAKHSIVHEEILKETDKQKQSNLIYEYQTRDGDTITYKHDGDLLNKEGGFCFVERKFRKSGMFSFSGSETINSADDVAYIFRELENSSVENSFVVLVNDKVPTIIHLGMGTFTSTQVNIAAIKAAYDAVGADKLYFVHNHPSGNLKCSREDVSILNVINKMLPYGVVQDGIIINTTSGEYGTFDSTGYTGSEKRPNTGGETPLSLHSFDIAVFSPDYNISNLSVIRDSGDVAAFVSSQRLGKRQKVSYLILDHSNRIIGNIHTAFQQIAGNESDLADEISGKTLRFGGTRAIMYGDFPLLGISKLNQEIKRISGDSIKLLDVVNVDGLHTKSAIDDGVMEDKADYNGELSFFNTDVGFSSTDSKIGRLEKLRNSRPVEITGEEIPYSEDLKEYKKNALEYGKKLRSRYENKNTGIVIELGKSGIKEVLNHDYKNIEQIQSIAAIPSIIENSIYIDSMDNTDTSVNKDVSKYHYYICGLKIGDTDYTVRAVVAEQPNGNRYYDHKLSHIEKGKLLDSLSGITTPGFNQETSLVSNIKDTKLLSILQTKELKKDEIVSEVETLSQSLSTSINIVRDINSIVDENVGEQSKKRGSKGWYDPKTGEVYLILPNAESLKDTQSTVLHEVVAHKGLRGLLGDSFKSTMESIFNSLPKEIQDSLLSEFKNKTTSAEEYCARMAETMSDPGIIQRICSVLKEALRKIGVDLKMTDGDIMYMLWKSKNRLEKSDTAMESMNKILRDQNVKRQIDEYDTLFRSSKPINHLPVSVEKKIDIVNDLQSRSERLYEGYVDRMIAVKKLQDLISKKTGKAIPDYMNVWMYENTLSSRNTYEISQFKEKYLNPMTVSLKKLVAVGLDERAIDAYVLAKHGLERNEYMRMKSVKEYIDNLKEDDIKEDLQRQVEGKTFSELSSIPNEDLQNLVAKLTGKDYSGLTAIQKELKDQSIEDFISEIESEFKPEIGDLWKRIKAVNDFSLKKWFESGMINRASYEKIKGMYKNYIPLRGFDETMAHDVYEYYTTEGNPFNNPLKSAGGRTSRADTPFPHLVSMAESSIVGGNKNLMKLHLFRLAQHDMASENPSGKLSVTKQWYVYEGLNEDGVEIWKPSTPKYSDNIEQYRENIEKHTEEMALLEAEKKATRNPSKLRIAYILLPAEANEHTIGVKLNGEFYQILVHGNPKVAQAVEGLNDEARTNNKFVKAVAWANRQMAANFTTRNPAFVVSNLTRDLIWSATALSVKESSEYRNRFVRNIPKASGALMRKIRGKQDLNNPVDVMLNEFLKNGGRTGYTALYSIEKYKKDIQSSIKTGKWAKTKRGYNAVLDFMQLPNEWAEDLSRFSTYMTSREEGRTILQSVSDAKEVTVNFNRKGSGKYGAGAFRGLFLFFNAAVQSLNNAYGLTLKNPRGMAVALAGFSIAGTIIPSILSMLGADDERDKYNGLPDYVRKNNLCIPLGWCGAEGFLKIPLPIELRAFYGIGDAVYRALTGEDEVSDAFWDVNLGLLDLVPLNPAGGSSNFTPDAFKPIFESYATNKDFTGKPIAKITPFNEYDPEYQRVYRSTSIIPVKVSEYLNILAGGDEAIRKFETYKTLSGADVFNPAAIEHLFESYLGGTFTTLNQSFKTFIGAPAGLNDFSWRNVPVLNRFYDTGDVDGTMMKVNEKYFDHLDEMKEAKNVYRKYENMADNSPALESAKYLDKLSKYEEGKEWKRAEFITFYAEQISDYMEEIKESTDEKRKDELQKEINRLKKEMVNGLKNGRIPN